MSSLSNLQEEIQTKVNWILAVIQMNGFDIHGSGQVDVIGKHEDAWDEASIKPLKEELPKILVEENTKVGSTEQTALYARIIQVFDAGDEASRKSQKEGVLKIVEEESSKQNVETKAKVIDENDGLIVDKDSVDSSKETEYAESVDRCGKEFKAKQEASRNSGEEPPLKKKS
ncbi:hypothetical protein MKW98_011842 [Papaver atlanticum]|uniref:Uncharacterized protein n=1 Tax=Papaver atlanticum TaxID=357466 RepID=A0AAD4SNN3_9MAGN|nr:hypothetical protein MKW98_011842 [Papaver atlanticum]